MKLFANTCQYVFTCIYIFTIYIYIYSIVVYSPNDGLKTRNFQQKSVSKARVRGFQGARMASGPFKMSAEAMKEAKGKAETAWSLGLCPICHESIKGGKVLGGGKRCGKS